MHEPSHVKAEDREAPHGVLRADSLAAPVKEYGFR